MWDGAQTVFEVRFSHASVSLSDVDIDIYFDAPGTVPGTNPPIATLSYGEIADAVDFEQGEYVITVTEAGDPNAVRFTSHETNLLPQFAHVITVFDGDGNDTAPLVVQSMTSVGNPLVFTDATYPPQTRFIHAAYTLETVDVYDDEALTNLLAADVTFQGSTGHIDTETDPKNYYFTPAGSQATVLFEQSAGAQPRGTYRYMYLIGATDDWDGARVAPDLASSSLSVKLGVFHASLNFVSVDLYVKNRGEPIEEDDNPLTFTAYGFLNSSVVLDAGSYDVYLTERATKTEVAAAYPIDVSLGDIVQLFIVDTVDPAIVELVELPIL